MFARAIATRQPTGPAPTTTSFFAMVGVGESSLAGRVWHGEALSRSRPPITHRDPYLRGAVSRHEKMSTFDSTPLPWSTFSETPDFIWHCYQGTGPLTGPVIFLFIFIWTGRCRQSSCSLAWTGVISTIMSSHHSSFLIPTNRDVGASRVNGRSSVWFRLISNYPLKRPPPPGEDSCIYLCGNSLGLLPQQAETLVQQEFRVWGSRQALSIAPSYFYPAVS
jgi:hypothetical protein